MAEQNGGPKASPIRTIDGQDASYWLQTLSRRNFLQDPDALYNELFWRPASEANGAVGTFYGQHGVYTGPTTTLGFADGTTTTYENQAVFKASFDNIQDGESFYAAFCNGKLLQQPVISRELFVTAIRLRHDEVQQDAALTKGGRSYYPPPVVELPSGQIAGYFPADNQDTAVLSITAFSVKDKHPSPLQRFSNVITQFLADCRSQGKRRLIIDVSDNGGGNIMLGYDAFRQVFSLSLLVVLWAANLD
jgi:hypothetical protein